MRGPISLVAALSAYLSAAAALPQSGLLPRTASDDQEKPKYSVVPLEPGDDQPGNGGGGGGHGTADVTVVKTVVKTQDPTTQIITKTADPRTITKSVPTTISVINISGDAKTTITVTRTPDPERTVTVHQSSPVMISSPSNSSPSCEETTRTKTILPTGRVPPTNGTLFTVPVNKTPTTFSTILITPTTISIITTAPQTSSSSRTYDDGQWRTTYPLWNNTLTYRYRRS